jgi:hypothetical protein
MRILGKKVKERTPTLNSMTVFGMVKMEMMTFLMLQLTERLMIITNFRT